MACLTFNSEGRPLPPKHRRLTQVRPGQWVCFQDRWRRVSHVAPVGDLVQVTFGTRQDPDFTTGPISPALKLRWSKRRPFGRQEGKAAA